MTTHCPGCTKCTLAVNPCQGIPSPDVAAVIAALKGYRKSHDNRMPIDEPCDCDYCVSAQDALEAKEQ